MGIRIHKILGYALDNVEPDDLRLKRDLNGLWRELDEDPEPLTKRFWEIMGEIEPIWTRLWNDEARAEVDLLDMLHSNPMRQHSAIWMFTPVDAPRWNRYDDTIDYYHERAMAAQDPSYDPHEEKLMKLHQPLHPYDKWIDKRRMDDDEHTEKLSWLLGISGVRDLCLKESILKEHSVLLDRLGYSIQEFKENVRPKICPSVVGFCKAADIFVDPDMVYELEPALYQYWA